jgi:hypothetical protein
VLVSWQVIVLAGLAAGGISLWVRRAYDGTAAAVAAALSTATLACLWLAYEVVPVEQWRRESLPVGLAIFALPAGAAVVIALLRSRSTRASGVGPRTGPMGLTPSAIAYLVALWATPAALLYVSQRTPFEGQLANLLWWAGSTMAIYVLVPVVYARTFGQSVRGYGLSVRFVRSEAVIIALIAPVALTLVWLVSSDQRFIDTYPFYKGDGWSLVAFEIAYGASFVTLEFFFRGFLVFAGQPVLGVHAVPVMAFSYCLLHLGKPLPEAASSLIGGLVLGYLALRLRSILAGIVAHLTIAWGMDAFVLSRT